MRIDRWKKKKIPAGKKNHLYVCTHYGSSSSSMMDTGLIWYSKFTFRARRSIIFCRTSEWFVKKLEVNDAICH